VALFPEQPSPIVLFIADVLKPYHIIITTLLRALVASCRGTEDPSEVKTFSNPTHRLQHPPTWPPLMRKPSRNQEARLFFKRVDIPTVSSYQRRDSVTCNCHLPV